MELHGKTTSVVDMDVIESTFLTIRLMKFVMLLGGFGRSWRRADHPRFLPNYKRQTIGCHWEFTKRSHPLYIPFGEDLASITKFLDTFYEKENFLSYKKLVIKEI